MKIKFILPILATALIQSCGGNNPQSSAISQNTKASTFFDDLCTTVKALYGVSLYDIDQPISPDQLTGSVPLEITCDAETQIITEKSKRYYENTTTGELAVADLESTYLIEGETILWEGSGESEIPAIITINEVGVSMSMLVQTLYSENPGSVFPSNPFFESESELVPANIFATATVSLDEAGYVNETSKFRVEYVENDLEDFVFPEQLRRTSNMELLVFPEN